MAFQAAAVERLEESKNKIEGLLDWISNIGDENKYGLDESDHISKENGNLPEEISAKGLIGEDDAANGNALQTAENDVGRETGVKNEASLDLDKQYDRVKVLLVCYKNVKCLFHSSMYFHVGTGLSPSTVQNPRALLEAVPHGNIYS